MKFDKNAPRYRAVKGTLEGGTGGITRMCSAVDFLEIYKVDKTFRLYTPESLDPEETDPNMQSMSKPSADVGSANKIVARVFIQASEAITNAPIADEISKDDILRCMHRCKEILLVCEDKQVHICKETEEICDKCNKGNLETEGYHIKNFPQVGRLEEYCGAFLGNAKLTIQTAAELVNTFYHTTFDGPRFDKVLTWSQSALKQYPPFNQFLADVQPGLKHIVDLRNAQEHPKANKKLIIDNFTLRPENNITVPIWHITGEEPEAIHSSTSAIVDFLVHTVESLFLHCLMDNIRSSFPFGVRTIPNTERDPACPIKYRVEPIIIFPSESTDKDNIEQSDQADHR